ncbi:MAG: hypothetical protein LAP40_26350 [Acidobacteriia bacterium]|nr:hypothetical protein [Terriglobia bacterium]
MWGPPIPARKGAVCAAVWLWVAIAASGQSRGEAEIALQGAYLGGTSQNLLDTSGVSAQFREWLPGLGYLSGSLEGYGSQNRLQVGENYAELLSVPWRGVRWTVTGGDFRVPGALVESPFYNLVNPEIAARGFAVRVATPEAEYMVFAGGETLSAGPRVAYRLRAPQTILGFSAVRRIKGLRIGARFQQFSSSPDAVRENPVYFPVGGIFGLARTAALQLAYSPMSRLKLYGEVSRPAADKQPSLTSMVAGMAWESERLTVRANWARQGTLYFPLAGLYAGDRQGPFAEARFRPWKGLEVFGSASQYRNNLEGSAEVVSLRSASTSAGLTLALPWKFAATGQVSTIRFSSAAPGAEAAVSHNRQVSATLSRNLGRHALHLNWRDLALDGTPARQRQRSTELEDLFHFRRFFVGGAARLQQATGSERRNSIYFRGSAQANLGRWSVYANAEVGNDLANRTLFATNTYTTSVAGVAVRLRRGWNLQTEAFRNRLNMAINRQSIFAMEASGTPVTAAAGLVSQWSLYIRLSKQLRWGGGLPDENADQYIAQQAPLTGSVEGRVMVRRAEGMQPAAGIPVSLDQGRSVVTDAAGLYLFEEVPIGAHDVALSAELPADYDPGEPSQARVMVQSRRRARTDFEVLPLASIDGQVDGPVGIALDGILIRMAPGGRYTTTDADGHYRFYNVREGDFDFEIDPGTLPENTVLATDARRAATVRWGVQAEIASFSLAKQSAEKPIRRVLVRE